MQFGVHVIVIILRVGWYECLCVVYMYSVHVSVHSLYATIIVTIHHVLLIEHGCLRLYSKEGCVSMATGGGGGGAPSPKCLFPFTAICCFPALHSMAGPQWLSSIPEADRARSYSWAGAVSHFLFGF